MVQNLPLREAQGGGGERSETQGDAKPSPLMPKGELKGVYTAAGFPR